MECESRKDLLLEYALGVLEDVPQQELHAHLQSGCPVCLGRLAEAHAILAMLPASLDPIRPPLGARQRVLAGLKPAPVDRARGPIISSSIPRAEKPLNRFRWIWPATMGGVLAASVTVLIFLNILSLERKSFDKLESKLQRQTGEIAQLHASAQEGRDMKRLVKSPAAQVVTLHGSAVQPTARGRLLWDPVSKTFHFFAEDLRNLPPGMAYELWLINGQGKKIPAAMCILNDRGEVEIVGSLNVDPGIVAASAVTDEPVAGVAAPTGAIQLVGNVN